MEVIIVAVIIIGVLLYNNNIDKDKFIKDIIELAYESVEEIAEQLKAGGENDDEWGNRKKLKK